MTTPVTQTWRSVQEEVRRRIHAREWKPGDLIPNEADLASEFGCARTTVNRALRALADSGLLDRRRKAGTRVARQPVAKATLEIAIIRHEVEERGRRYGYQLIARDVAVPPVGVSGAMKTGATETLLHIRALHLADNAPYALEDRWINTRTVPGALKEDFEAISANEWLLEHVPFTGGDITIEACRASAPVAEHLACADGEALLTLDRMTWDHDRSVTRVRVCFAPGHGMRTSL